MKKTRRRAVATVAGCAVVAGGAALGLPGMARAASTVLVPGSAGPAGHGMTFASAAPASLQLTIQVWLKPDLAAAATFATAVATPGSPEFHHYLSPDAYTARFGPSAAGTAAVSAWLTAEGLTQVRADRGRDYVSATGPVSSIQSAFGLKINKYRVTGAAGPSTVIEPSARDVSVPASLAPDVLAVTGLDSAPPATSAAEPLTAPATRVPDTKTPACSHYWAQHVRSFRPAYQGLTRGALPVCGYSADQVRAAYGATMASTGRGQTVAVTEDGSPPIAMVRTLTQYAKSNHLPALRHGQFRELQVPANCGSSSRGAAPPATRGAAQPATGSATQPEVNDEAEMDAEAVYAMAPGANQLMVLGQVCHHNEDQAHLDADLAVLTGNGRHPLATIVSNSWVIGDGSSQTVHAIDVRAAAEGVGMYFAAGDDGGLSEPALDPYAVAVGGTTLGIGAKNDRLFETGWSDDLAVRDSGRWSDLGISSGTGGGTSRTWRQPAYQKGVVPASMSRIHIGKRVVTGRTVPDIAADGDVSSGILTGYIGSGTKKHPGPYQTLVNAGTSLATPLIAGLVADAQQGQKASFGFINPLLYRLAGTRALHDILPVTASMPQPDRDVYTPASGTDSASINLLDDQKRADTKQLTAQGYDTMTGVGTPNGAAFIAGLRRAARCG